MGAKRRCAEHIKRRNPFAFQDMDVQDLRVIIHTSYVPTYGKKALWEHVFSIDDYEALYKRNKTVWLSDAIRLLKDYAIATIAFGGPFGDMPRCSSVGVYVNSMLYGDEDYIQRDLDGSLFLHGAPGSESKIDWEGDCKLLFNEGGGRKKNPIRRGETYDSYLRRLAREAQSDPQAAEELVLASQRAKVDVDVLGRKGVPVFARNEQVATGKTTGGTRHCSLSGCRGIRIGVRWDDTTLTWPCSKGLKVLEDGIHII